jgi:hypothetical protein
MHVPRTAVSRNQNHVLEDPLKLYIDPAHLADIEATHSCNERFNGDWDTHHQTLIGLSQYQRGSQ